MGKETDAVFYNLLEDGYISGGSMHHGMFRIADEICNILKK